MVGVYGDSGDLNGFSWAKKYFLSIDVIASVAAQKSADVSQLKLQQKPSKMVLCVTNEYTLSTAHVIYRNRVLKSFSCFCWFRVLNIEILYHRNLTQLDKYYQKFIQMLNPTDFASFHRAARWENAFNF